jgi:tetratricopeptide (TPR) repeat protein
MPGAYDWYQKGLKLLSSGDNHAAATLLERAAAVEVGKSSIHEALARAYFGSRRFDDALTQFEVVLDISPANDYAHFGAGLCLRRLGRFSEAVGHLRMAAVMHPENEDYRRELALSEARLAISRKEEG